MVRAQDEEAAEANVHVSGEAPGHDVDAEAFDLLELDDAELDLDTPGQPEADSQPRRRRLRWFVIAGLAGVLVVLIALLGPTWWQLVTQRHAKLATPDSLAGLTLDTSQDGKATADYLRTAVAASVQLDTSVGAVYDDPDDAKRSVMFFGGTGLLVSPDTELTKAFRLLDDQGGDMTGVQSVPVGTLGGEMKCGTSTGDGGDMVVCGWADHGSIALALFPGRTVDEAAALMQHMRAGIQHQG